MGDIIGDGKRRGLGVLRRLVIPERAVPSFDLPDILQTLDG
jgi:hypothetical protein